VEKAMKNVMQLIQHPYIGGLEKMAFGLCQAASEQSNMHLVTLEGTKHNALDSWPELSKLKHLECLNKGSGFSLKAVEQLVRIIDKYKINVIHSHHIGPLLYASMVKIRRPHIKHIHTLHDAWYLNNRKLRFITQCVRALTPVTVVADAKAIAKEAFKAAKIQSDHVVLNGIDTDSFTPSSRFAARKRLGLSSDYILVGCAARVEAGKGHEAMLRSLIDLPSKIHMVFAGTGSQLKAYQEYAIKLGVDKRVTWLGKVDNMPTFYSAIDVFCLFSQREGLPLSILEAMACNRPVVASDVGGIKEVMNEKSGFIVPLAQEKHLPQYLLKAAQFKYGMDIRHYAVEVGTIKVMANNYSHLYSKLMA
jgi:glycosyltransferase involved in cell wall biosynthesis